MPKNDLQYQIRYLRAYLSRGGILERWLESKDWNENDKQEITNALL